MLSEFTPKLSRKAFITKEGHTIAFAFSKHFISISLILSRVVDNAEETRDGISIEGSALTS